MTAAMTLAVNAVKPTSRDGWINVAALDAGGYLVREFNVPAQITIESCPHGSQQRVDARLQAGTLRWPVPPSLHGPHTIAVSCPGLPDSRTCLWPGFSTDGEIFFGETHLHSSGSNDGHTDPPDVHRFAIDVAGLNFVAITDHAYHLKENGRWPQQLQAARKATRDGEFVALLGYEWDGNPRHGHVGVLFADPPQEVIVAASVGDLWMELERSGLRFITRPNHVNAQAEQMNAQNEPAWGPYRWSDHNEARQPLMEVVTPRGSFEAEKDEPGQGLPPTGLGSSLRSALGLGYHLGVTGGSDSHRGLPPAGAERLTGLTAIVADSLTHDHIWSALTSRRTYATTGIRALVDFRVDGQPMGEQHVEEQQPDSREISLRVLAPASIMETAIIKNGRVWRSLPGRDKLLEATVTDETIAYGLPCAASAGGRHDYYYARVIFEGGHVLWTSPVFMCGSI